MRGFFIFARKEIQMGSKTMKTEKIRFRKHTSNKVNRAADQDRVRENQDLLAKLEGKRP